MVLGLTSRLWTLRSSQTLTVCQERSNCEKMQLGLSPGSTVLVLLWGSILFMISSIFVVKKFKKSSPVNEELGGGYFFVSLLKI